MFGMNYKEKYYRVCVNINLDALCGNITRTKKLLAPGVKLMVVIKADGYGHGAVPVAHALDELTENGKPVVEAYAVAIPEEAKELRKAGITKPILILGVTVKEQLSELIANDVTLTVFDLSYARQISEEAVRQNKTAKIHIKLDTGMGRIGYSGSEQDAEEVLAMTKLPNIFVEGLFSHFATADEADKAFTEKQMERFEHFEQMLKARSVRIPTRHICNSAAIMELPQMHMEMVRSGISTYGLYPSTEVNQERLKLEPILELKSRIAFVKEVNKGFQVGYGATFVTERKTRIATIPVGYADGYPRSLSNKGRILVHGKSARILGRICMDQFMVDVTDIPEAKAGDLVTLIGQEKEECIPVEEIASLTGTINYEVTCDIAKRVPRVYYRGGRPVELRTEFGME